MKTVCVGRRRRLAWPPRLPTQIITNDSAWTRGQECRGLGHGFRIVALAPSLHSTPDSFLAMATLPDSLGLITSTNDPVSLEHFEHALASLFRSDGNAMPTIECAIARDPAFVAGHCLRAGTLVLRGADTPAEGLAASVASIEGNSGANERERRHAAAARHWLDGDVARAARLYGALLGDYPRDRLALLVAYGLDFRLGRHDMLRDRVAKVLPHWDERDPEYGYVVGMHAFGLE